jgi:hypothetical protein
LSTPARFFAVSETDGVRSGQQFRRDGLPHAAGGPGDEGDPAVEADTVGK